MTDLDRDLAAFEAMRGELESHHHGKWVVFFEGRFVEAFGSFEEAAQNAVQRFGRGPYLIKQVGAPPVTLPASLMYHVLNG